MQNKKLVTLICISLAIFTVSCGTLVNKQLKSETKIQVRNFPNFEENDLLKMEKEILSYASLSEVIRKYKLEKDILDSDEVTTNDIDKTRERISIKLTDKSKSIFTISYSDNDATKARDVTAEIASKFVVFEFEEEDDKPIESEPSSDAKVENVEAKITPKPMMLVIDPANLPIS